MRQPNETQKGAVFGVIAASLVVALTFMAMKAVDQSPHPQFAARHHHVESVQTATTESNEDGG